MDKEKNNNLETTGKSCCEPSITNCCSAPNNLGSMEINEYDNYSKNDLNDGKENISLKLGYDNQVTLPTLKEGINIPQKLKVDIYVPLDACSCQWVQFMNLMFSALTPYIKYIKHETRSLNSEEARKLNLKGNCVIVDRKKKYSTSHALKKDLPALLEEKGLI